ncbi:MAG: efflux RND transporter periplasmic adaptor subunit [Desulfuromonadales bacterium]|nr:efflux RND transporter periplasmic adaptor subunit [Desulfuromonadales bacterium]
MSKRTKVVMVMVLLLLIGGGFLWKKSQKPPQVKILASVEVTRGPIRKVLEETGIVKAQVGAIVKIGARSTGSVERMLVRVGDPVKKGQVVATIDSRELRAQIAETEAQLAEAEARASYTRSNVERLAALYDGKFISRDEMEGARQNAEVASRQVAARLAARDSLRVRLSYTEVKSPIDGVVSQIAAQEGEMIVAGLQVANLVTVIDPTRLEMWTYVDETDIGQVAPGMGVEFRVDSWPGRIFHGKIRTIQPQPEVRDNIVYYQAIVDVAAKDALELRPEMTTQAQVVVQTKDDVLLIPNNALKWVEDQQVVFVQGADGAIRRVSAELGLAGVKESEVLAGLQAGDKVATQVELSGEKIKNPEKKKGSK